MSLVNSAYFQCEDDEEFEDYLRFELRSAEIDPDQCATEYLWNAPIPPRGEWFTACRDLISHLRREWEKNVPNEIEEFCAQLDRSEVPNGN